jgi:hypothetical protein
MSRGPDTESGTVRCPTCRASQEWSDACRRCKSDLRLLRAFAAAYERSRRSCLDAIRDGDPRAASHHAQICHAFRPDADSRRLLALAAFLRGDWHAVAVLASRDG